MDQPTLRGLLLGPVFAPRVEDIPTPPLLLDKDVPDGILRLVSLSATVRTSLSEAAGDNGTTYLAFCIASALRMRDGGAADGRGTYVIGKLDDSNVSVPDFVAAAVLPEQDFDLQSALGAVVKPFLRLKTVEEAAADEKKASSATPSTGGGSASPASSDSQTSE